jgi:sigma-B regulation protein RsbU (phosphoserine phosphatase)
MTLNVIRLEQDKVVVSGKHQDFFIWRAAQRKVEVVSNVGPWIGVIDDVSHAVEDQALELAEGDCLMLHTDGLTEAVDGQGVMFGDARLAAAFERAVGSGASLRAAVAAILQEVEGHMVQRADDLTLVLLRRLK